MDDRAAPPTDVGSWRLSAHAKLNLGLEILGRRADGFHEIVSVTQTVSLADTLEVTNGGPFSVEMDPPLATGEQNLAERAALALAAEAGSEPNGRLTIRKRIPLAAGMGGGSSDAAATLRLLNRVWDARLDAERLATIAGTLGSDVPLFLAGATSLIRGRGEVVEPLASPPTFWVVLSALGGSPPDKTRSMYQALAPDNFTDGAATLALAAAIRGGRPVRASLLINGFTAAAERVYPGFAERRERLAEHLQAPVHLTGAGPTLFAIFNRPDAAHAAARRARRAHLPVSVVYATVGRPAVRASRGTLAR